MERYAVAKLPSIAGNYFIYYYLLEFKSFTKNRAVPSLQSQMGHEVKELHSFQQ